VGKNERRRGSPIGVMPPGSMGLSTSSVCSVMVTASSSSSADMISCVSQVTSKLIFSTRVRDAS
jgi:hypothetical protein